MKNKILRTLTLLVAIVLIVSACVACQAAATPTSTAGPTPTPTPLPNVTLNFYLLGPEPAGMKPVSDALNALSTKDLNASVVWTFLGWDKWDQKYKLALASGETIDAIYTANWANYATYAANGAFMALDDLLPKFAPASWAGMTKEQWNQAKVGGVIYTVPCDWKEYTTDDLTYRADIAKKYGFNSITSLDQMEQFLLAYKKDHPTELPFNGTSTDMGGQWQMFLKDYTPLGSNWWMLEDSTGKLVSLYETPAYLAYAQMQQRWYQEGFWSKDILSNTVISEDLFRQGKNIVCQENPTKANTMYQQIHKDHPDWELGVLTYAQVNGWSYTTASIRNGVALPKNSPNPERALMYVDKLRNDAKYYDLTEYGVLGTNYTLDTAGNYVAASSDTGFGYMSMQPWGWHVTKMELPTLGDWPGYKDVYALLDKIVKTDKYATFAFDSTNVSGQDAAIKQVLNVSFSPINAGVVEGDVATAIATANAALKTAGLDAYIAEVQKQRDTYLADQAKN